MKTCVIVYTVIMIQCAITATVIYIKAKKTDELYSLLACQVAILLWTFFGMIEYMSRNAGELLSSVKLTMLPLMFISSLWLIFSMFYSGKITSKNKILIISLILLPPILCAWPLLTTKYAYLLIISKAFGYNGITEWGTLFLLNQAISYIYIIASAVIILKKSSTEKRKAKRGWPLILAMACRLNSIFYTGSENFVQDGGLWYSVYLTYAANNGITSKTYNSYTRAITRAECAEIFVKALPAEAMAAINTVSDGAIPDVPASASYSQSVYLLYRAGIIVGSDAAGTFKPTSNISRAEAAAIVTRMADISLRQSVTLTK